jgi:hypothetical protein
MIAFALVLLLASAAGWIAAKGAPARTRSYLRIAAALYGALALGDAALGPILHLLQAPELAAVALVSITDLVVTLGSGVLCVAATSAFRAPPGSAQAGVVLGLAACIGLSAALTGFAALAAVPQVAAAGFILLLSRPGLWQRPSIYLALSALSLIGGAACQLTPGLAAGAGVLLFEAAAVVGVAIASNVLVEQRNKDKRPLAVGSNR